MRTNTSDNDHRAERQCYTNAERRDDDIRFGVIAVLERLIPPIEHLDDRTAHADGQNCGDDEASDHSIGSVARLDGCFRSGLRP